MKKNSSKETATLDCNANDWTENDWKMLHDWLKGVLQTSMVTVTFTKKDGTERKMKCTLDPEVLPKEEIKEGKSKTPRKKSENTLAVYDTEIKEWRSFTLKSVSQIAFDF